MAASDDVVTVAMVTNSDPSPVETLYSLFGVSADAPVETIRRAWLIRITRVHPDRHAQAEESVRAEMGRRAAELNAGWSVLRDEIRRLEYDLQHRLRPAGCSVCGSPGVLRRHGDIIVAACDRCAGGTASA